MGVFLSMLKFKDFGSFLGNCQAPVLGIELRVDFTSVGSNHWNIINEILSSKFFGSALLVDKILGWGRGRE